MAEAMICADWTSRTKDCVIELVTGITEDYVKTVPPVPRRPKRHLENYLRNSGRDPAGPGRAKHGVADGEDYPLVGTSDRTRIRSRSTELSTLRERSSASLE